jgi:hypothetical protein
VKRRQAQIAEQSPSPIMAIPTPTPVYHPHRHRSAWEHLTGRGGAGALSAEDEARMAEAEAGAADMGKAANVGQAADQVLGRIKSQQMDVWNRMMTPVDAKPAKPAKPEPPPPPQLPTLAGKGMAATTGPPSAAKG